MSDSFETFEEFWPHYVLAHSQRKNRMLHFAGTSAAAALLAAGLLTGKKRLLLLAPIVGYGAAWIGHFGVEGNKPATFGHPLWSFKADMIMWKKTLDGTMDDEVRRVLFEHGFQPEDADEGDVVPGSWAGRPDPTVN